jgi:hypothetical protein
MSYLLSTHIINRANSIPQAGLEVLMLQVSYSFFNKIGPSTCWSSAQIFPLVIKSLNLGRYLVPGRCSGSHGDGDGTPHFRCLSDSSGGQCRTAKTTFLFFIHDGPVNMLQTFVLRIIDKLTFSSVVSLALGRPFAIQDDDITVEVCHSMHNHSCRTII